MPNEKKQLKKSTDNMSRQNDTSRQKGANPKASPEAATNQV